MTVTRGASGAKMMVPPPTPGPVPAVPAVRVSPTGEPRLWAGFVLPRVNVTAAMMRISRPAQMTILPSVAVIALRTFTSRPALSNMLPLVVVIAAPTLMSRPQQATILPFVAVIAALILRSRKAFIVKVVAALDAVQAIASLMMMSPLPGVLLPARGIVLMMTLVVTNWAESVAPVIFPPIAATT